LPLAEFVSNNASSATIKVSPFFANRGYNPRMNFNIRSEVKKPKNPHKKNKRQRAIEMATRIKSIWEFVRDQTGIAQTRMEHFANAIRKPAPRYQSGDKVWLSAKNIKTQRPSKKLDAKNLRPYESNLLRLDPDDLLPGQIQKISPPVVIDSEEEWEVARLLDSRLYYGRLQYRVEWKGHLSDPV
jgi:hypothetical protein